MTDRLFHNKYSPLTGLDPSDPKVEDTIRTLLAKRVDEMVQKARESAADVQDALPDKLEVLHRVTVFTPLLPSDFLQQLPLPLLLPLLPFNQSFPPNFNQNTAI